MTVDKCLLTDQYRLSFNLKMNTFADILRTLVFCDMLMLPKKQPEKNKAS